MFGEIAEVVVFSPNRGGAVVEHCRKYMSDPGQRDCLQT